ncbi:SigE family RNA polymerase sigma factor [Nonomuraea sp. SBT364]|uniref:SigE family RNA polymerase sigma factor n=1 Tax=Nonomuraea sp. SBT364 TaxID=1580530 RepID=UPI00066AF984|nr:SigE family RNA polymerase sigma factor [Nonomuraea sp. SBT364]
MGSREAFEEFVAARRPQLLRAAWLITGDRELAEDLLQEALIKLARAWPRVHTDPAAYVRTILYRDAVSWWRRRRTHTVGQTDLRVVDAAEQVVLRVTFTGALARLTVRQRAVLVLRYLEDLSVAETAQVLGVSTGTVKSQTSVALERLRRVAPELRGLTEEADS